MIILAIIYLLVNVMSVLKLLFFSILTSFTVVFQDKAARLVALFQKKRPYSGQAGFE